MIGSPATLQRHKTSQDVLKRLMQLPDSATVVHSRTALGSMGWQPACNEAAALRRKYSLRYFPRVLAPQDREQLRYE